MPDQATPQPSPPRPELWPPTARLREHQGGAALQANSARGRAVKVICGFHTSEISQDIAVMAKYAEMLSIIDVGVKANATYKRRSLSQDGNDLALL